MHKKNDAIDNEQDLQPNPTIDAEKTNENQITTSSEDHDEVQIVKSTTNRRAEKYNSRPNSNPNFSDSNRY